MCYSLFSQTQRSPHVFYRHDLINQLQHNHALVTLVAENLSAYMETMRQLSKGTLSGFLMAACVTWTYHFLKHNTWIRDVQSLIIYVLSQKNRLSLTPRQSDQEAATAMSRKYRSDSTSWGITQLHTLSYSLSARCYSLIKSDTTRSRKTHLLLLYKFNYLLSITDAPMEYVVNNTKWNHSQQLGRIQWQYSMFL